MPNTRLLFGSDYIDVGSSEDFPLSINASIADIADISKRKGTYTNTFKVPATQHNNDVLKSIWQDQVDSESIEGVVYGRNDARIEVDGITWDSGYAKVGAVLKDSQPIEYEIVFFGGLSDWISRVGDAKLNELDNSTTATFNKAEAWAAMSGTEDWVYPLINYGGWVSAQFPLGTTDVPFGVSTRDLRPAMRINAIVDQIFEDAGYTIESNWLSSTECTGTVYLAGDFNKLPSDRINTRAIEATANFSTFLISNVIAYHYQQSVTEENDTQNIFGAATTATFTPFNFAPALGTYTYIPITVPFDGFYNLDFNAVVDVTGSFSLDRALWEFRDVVADTQEVTGLYRTNEDAIYQDVTTVYLEQAKTYAFGVIVREEFLNPRLIAMESFDLHLWQNQSVGLYDVFKPYKTLGEEKQLDFLANIAKQFNLYFDTDTMTRTVKIEPRNDWTDTAGSTQTGYYKGISSAVDWSGKLDRSNPIKIKFLSDYKDELEFKWSDIGDYYPEEWEDVFKFHPFRELYTFPNNYNQGRSTVEMPYVPTINKYEDAKLNNGVQAFVQMPFILDDEPGDTSIKRNVEARLLHYEWTNEDDYLLRPRAWIWYDDTATADLSGVDPTNSFELPANYDNFTNIPKAWVVNYDDTTKFQLSPASYGEGKGIADRFYNETVRDLRTRTLYEAHIRLRTKDMLPFFQLDGFNTPVHIDGVYYRINKIAGYKPHLEGSTKVELFKIVPRSAIDFGSETISELVNFEG